MKFGWQGRVAKLVLIAGGLAGAMIVAGCSGPKYPDAEEHVNTALTQNNLSAVHVSQDRNKGVITLTGTVPTEAQKEQAESVAREAAGAYDVTDEITVVPPVNANAAQEASSQTDSTIEDQFKTDLTKHALFQHDDISVSSKDGSVTLSGTAKSEYDKRAAEKLAKAIPNVHQVVNEIAVKVGQK